jgi:hypothetical protein
MTEQSKADVKQSEAEIADMQKQLAAIDETPTRLAKSPSAGQTANDIEIPSHR